MHRRTFLGQGLVAFSLMATRAPLSAAAETEVPATFSTFADTILPEDEFGPSATQAGIVTPTWRRLTAHKADQEFAHLGCVWLDQQGGKPFHRLSDEGRHRIVQWMASSASTEAPNVFYSRVRAGLMQRYYLQTVPQKLAGLAHPPQPNGYRAPLLEWSNNER